MARTLVTVQEADIAGLNPVFTAAITDGHMFVPTGGEVIHVKNTDTASHTVTIPTPVKVGGLDIVDPAVVVPNAGERWIGVRNQQYFIQTDGMIYIDYTGLTGVSIAVVRVK